MDEVPHLLLYTNRIFNIFTSIIPCLSLRGVAAAIARSRSIRAKVLLRMTSSHSMHPVKRSKFLVNARNDRETDGYTAVDYIRYSDTLFLGSAWLIFPQRNRSNTEYQLPRPSIFIRQRQHHISYLSVHHTPRISTEIHHSGQCRSCHGESNSYLTVSHIYAFRPGSHSV
jgi:hypothetical protein